ncbi:hypothetical protein BCR42DRAFT_422534, partial [Absidia repens]
MRKNLPKHNSSALAMMGPYLVQHHDRVYWITMCYCDKNSVHASCLSSLLLNTNTSNSLERGQKPLQPRQNFLTCPSCHYYYRTGWRVGWVRLMVCCVHLLSLASVVGLVYGLSSLGRSLDQLGLGNEMGTKLDGDENWQDHEMQAIADWLNLVHLVTALAGEALLGLVYVVGVCGIIGADRTVQMIYAILYLDLTPILSSASKRNDDDHDLQQQDPPPRTPPTTTNTTTTTTASSTTSSTITWFHYGILWFALVCFGLIFGTWLLFYSWVWACLFHFLCRRILNVRKPIHDLPSTSSTST